ncbi:major facilitator superfamily domain-containing protein 12-like [Lampetra fluviatilis]
MGGPNGTPIFRAPTTAAPATEPLGRMTLASRLAFAGGHFFNDVCAATWFTYGLAFLHGVAGIGSPGAGLLVLLGQVADGLATPLVGIAADRAPAIPGMARRKSWHLLGTVLLTLTFPFTFASCLACGLAPQEGTLLGYYAPFIVLSQVAWAAVQVSHLALIPELAHTQSEKVELTAYR